MSLIRAEGKVPVLALDAGNLLFKNLKPTPGLQAQEQATAEGIAAAYHAMGFDGVAVAGQDLTAGLAFLKKIRDASPMSWLSANLVQKNTETPIFTPYLVRELAGLRVAVIGLTDGQAAGLLSETDGAAVLAWQKVLPPLVSKLAASSDLLVLLSSYPPATNLEIASTVGSIHLIVQAGAGIVNFNPQLTAGNTLILQTGKQGKYLGQLNVHWTASRTWQAVQPPELLQNRKNEFEGLETRIKSYQEQSSKEALAADQGYQNLLKDKARVLAQIESLNAAAARSTGVDQPLCTYSNSFITLEKSMPDDPAVLEILEKTKQRVNEIGAGVQGRQSYRPQSEPANPADHGIATSQAYAGSRPCAACHQAPTAFWEKTRHAAAFESLVKNQQDLNPVCLSCHVTAGEGASGEALLMLPAELRQVGCEACHGPGRGHALDPASQRLAAKPAATVCQRCHTPEKDDSFSYETDARTVGCPAS